MQMDLPCFFGLGAQVAKYYKKESFCFFIWQTDGPTNQVTREGARDAYTSKIEDNTWSDGSDT